MKLLHYCKVLLFSVPLNILVHNKNKSYITPRHKPTPISRVLSECDLYISSCDNDPDMKSVKENFDRQTSQRFEEYEKRMIKNRKRCKEQCDKDIQKIILKDKMEKSLAENLEKYCLRCGCGLGGVAAGVGIFGALGTYGWKVAATATAIELATKEGIDAGVSAAIAEIQKIHFIKSLSFIDWSKFIHVSNYSTVEGLVEAINAAMDSIGKSCISFRYDRVCSGISHGSDYFISSAVKAGEKATAAKTTAVKEIELAKVTGASSSAYAAIGYSVTAILIIVLVMIIIYLILRYRRKKKMNKKAQYTKLLNQ
ncbi:rifin [Plasmodium falciparum RAJ116]|uniref:Rifin n=1 Tax=Plasmodium falciparum RAJ116 TaxID=580058 RepID=A0A0L0CRR1_PLAFA|nr:rifin [Plasmodium falciparum RAJ116]